MSFYPKKTKILLKGSLFYPNKLRKWEFSTSVSAQAQQIQSQTKAYETFLNLKQNVQVAFFFAFG